MNQKQVEEWVAANGGQGGVQYTRATKRIKNPLRDVNHPDYDPSAPEYVEVSEEKWTNPQSGAVLHAQRQPDGETFAIIEQSGPKPTAVTTKAPASGAPFRDDDEKVGSAGRRWGWNPETGLYDRDLGPSPAAQGIAPAPAASTRTPEQQASDAAVAQTNQITATQKKREDDERSFNRSRPPEDDPMDETHGQREARLAKKAFDAAAAAEKNKPQAIAGTAAATSKNIGFLQPDGAIRWEPNPNFKKPDAEAVSAPPAVRSIIYRGEDGALITTPNPNYKPPSKVDRDPETNELIEVTEDADGKPIVRPVKQEGAKPPAAPTPMGDPGVVGQLTDWLIAEKAKIDQRVASGELTKKQAIDEMTARTAFAETRRQETAAVTGAATQIYDADVAQGTREQSTANTRLTTGAGMYNNTLNTALPMIAKMPVGNGEVGRQMLAGLLGGGQDYVRQMGGLRDVPRASVPGPLAQLGNSPLPGTPRPSPGMTAAAPASAMTAPTGTASTGAGPLGGIVLNFNLGGGGHDPTQPSSAALPEPILRPPPVTNDLSASLSQPARDLMPGLEQTLDQDPGEQADQAAGSYLNMAGNDQGWIDAVQRAGQDSRNRRRRG